MDTCAVTMATVISNRTVPIEGVIMGQGGDNQSPFCDSRKDLKYHRHCCKSDKGAMLFVTSSTVKALSIGQIARFVYLVPTTYYMVPPLSSWSITCSSVEGANARQLIPQYSMI